MDPARETLVILRGDCQCACHARDSDSDSDSDSDGPGLANGVPCGCEPECLCADGECDAFCPHCGTPVSTYNGDFWSEDYIATNCLLWCPEHREVLLCLTKGGADIDRLLRHEPARDSCAQELSPEQAERFAAEKGFPLRRRAAAADRFFRTGVLAVTRVGRPRRARLVGGDPRGELASWAETPAATSFSAIPPGIDTSHDGAYLLYEAGCAGCGRAHPSYIWGD